MVAIDPSVFGGVEESEIEIPKSPESFEDVVEGSNGCSSKKMKLYTTLYGGTNVVEMKKKILSHVENSKFRKDKELTSNSDLSHLNLSIEAVLTDENITTMKNIAKNFLTERIYTEETFRYSFDGLHYKGTIICKTENLAGGLKVMSYNLKLSNDGFLYSCRSDLQVHRNNIRRHNHGDWCLLDIGSCRKFQDGSKLANIILGRPDKTQTFYNEHNNRVDLKYIDSCSKNAMCITFEPGYPENDFEDVWLDMDNVI